MALSMGTYPLRKRLPVSYSTEIGRIITRWSIIEWHMKRLAYGILKISQKSGRVAVQDPRANDYITMIEDLLSIRGVKTNIDWKIIKNDLDDIESFRNKLAHWVWIRHTETSLPVLQEIRGKHPNEKDASQKKARINPKALAVRLNDLRHYRKRIDAAAKILDQIRQELKPVLRSLPAKSP